MAFGATTSSEGTWPVCRLPLAAFSLWTSGVLPRRPAAVIQYDNKVSGTKSHRMFSGGSASHAFLGSGGALCVICPQRGCQAVKSINTENALPCWAVTHTIICHANQWLTLAESIRRKRELFRGRAAPMPACLHLGCCHPAVTPSPSQQNVALACLFASPARTLIR